MCRICLDRRQFFRSALAGAAALAAKPVTAFAQFYPLLCSWSGGWNTGQGLAPGAPIAIQQVQLIAQAIEFPVPLEVFMGGVPNAAATMINGPAIVYNPAFLDSVAFCHPPAAMTILAHEVGHHAMLDTTWAGQWKHPWQKELGADWVSGLAMKRLGATLQDTLSGIQCSFGPFSPASPTHPDSQNRMAAIVQGWQAG